MPSRPGEFHPETLTEPDVILSHHPAHAITRRLLPVEGGSRFLCIDCQIGSVGLSKGVKQNYLAQTMVEQKVADKSKRRELWGFLFLTVIFAPTLAVAIVGGYGFLVWMYQLGQGPPAY